MRILVFTFQPCRRVTRIYIFNMRAISTPYTLKLRNNVAFLCMVLLTDIYRSVISLRMNEQLPAFYQKKAPVRNVLICDYSLNLGSILLKFLIMDYKLGI